MTCQEKKTIGFYQTLCHNEAVYRLTYRLTYQSDKVEDITKNVCRDCARHYLNHANVMNLREAQG